MMMSIEARGPVHILLPDELINEMDNRQAIQRVHAHIAEGRKHLVVDLQGLGFINSVGLSFLVAVLRHSREAGGDVVLLHPSEHLLKLLRITKLDSIFRTAQSEEEALRQFAHA